MTEITPTEEVFAYRGYALGAKVFRIEDPISQTPLNWAVLFPSGYVEFVAVLDSGDARAVVPGDTVALFAELHHPLAFVDSEAIAMEYWRKRAHHFRAGV